MEFLNINGFFLLKGLSHCTKNLIMLGKVKTKCCFEKRHNHEEPTSTPNSAIFITISSDPGLSFNEFQRDTSCSGSKVSVLAKNTNQRKKAKRNDFRNVVICEAPSKL